MFEKLLARSREGRRSATAVSLPAAIGLHALAAAAVVGASLWWIEEPPEPPVSVAFFVPAASSAPPGPTAARRGGRSEKRQAATAVVPATVPETVPEDVVEPALPVNPEAPDSGDPGEGGVSGSPGGVPSGTGPGSANDSDGEPPRPGGDIRSPELTRRIEPVYPEAARKARQEGLVVLEAVIAASGAIEEVRVVKSAGVLLDSAAAEAVRLWRYRPATLNGRAVRVLLTVTVSFRLH